MEERLIKVTILYLVISLIAKVFPSPSLYRHKHPPRVIRADIASRWKLCNSSYLTVVYRQVFHASENLKIVCLNIGQNKISCDQPKHLPAKILMLCPKGGTRSETVHGFPTMCNTKIVVTIHVLKNIQNIFFENDKI